MMPQPVGGMQQFPQQPMPQQQQPMMLSSTANPFSLGGMQYQMVPGPARQMSGLAGPAHHHEPLAMPPQQQMIQVAGGGPADLAASAGFVSSGAPSALQQPPTPFTSAPPMSTGNQLAAKLQALGLDGSSAPGQGPAQQAYGGPMGATTGGMFVPAGLQPVSMAPEASGAPAWLPASSFACAASAAPSSSATLGFAEGPAAMPMPAGCMAGPGDGAFAASAAGGQGADAVAASQGPAAGSSSAQALANLLLAVRDRGMLTTHTTIGDLIGMLQQQAA